MTPTYYIQEICRPNVDDFISDPTSIRKAWAAVVALAQFADYVAASRGVSKSAIRKELETEFPNFSLVADVANANKHFEVDRQSKRIGLSIVHLQVGKAAAFSDGSFFSDGTSWTESPNVMRADFQSEHVDLLYLCKSCLEYLQTKT